MPLHDLRCDGGHVHRDEYVKTVPGDDDFGPCSTPGCSAHLHQYWGETHAVRKADGFTPRTIDGQRFDTRDAWNAHLGRLQKAHPNLEIVVDSHTPARARAEGEEGRHEAFQRIGVGNERELRQYIREAKAQPRPSRNQTRR